MRQLIRLRQMEKINKYEITNNTNNYALGYEESENGKWLKVEDVEKRLLEIKSRVCTCEFPESIWNCHGCRIIEELFGKIEDTIN